VAAGVVAAAVAEAAGVAVAAGEGRLISPHFLIKFDEVRGVRGFLHTYTN